MANTTIDLTGKVFGTLEVIELDLVRSSRTKYWKCRCICCGKVLSLQSQYLRNGRPKLCRHPGRDRGKLIGVAASLAYADYKSGAKKRELTFDITPEQFVYLTSQCCIYCGTEPSKLWKSKAGDSTYISNGIDRIDNAQGYKINNCVPCCKLCNYAKRDIPFDEYTQWLDTIARRGLQVWKKSTEQVTEHRSS